MDPIPRPVLPAAREGAILGAPGGTMREVLVQDSFFCGSGDSIGGPRRFQSKSPRDESAASPFRDFSESLGYFASAVNHLLV